MLIIPATVVPHCIMPYNKNETISFQRETLALQWIINYSSMITKIQATAEVLQAQGNDVIRLCIALQSGS